MSGVSLSGAGEQLALRRSQLADSAAFGHYERVRERVLAMKDADAARDGVPSAYWQDELEWFAYMYDASPFIIDRLRWHTHHVTGIKAYDYRAHKDPTKLSTKLEALLADAADADSTDLFVPEHEALGGFGFVDKAGRRFNVDTLKFFEVLIALQRGAVLPELRKPQGPHKLVWEIGAGWGGFAYQFKTICPKTTYLIVDLPELFLFSGTYLQTVFPEAKVRFYTDVEDSRLFDDWQELDFIFIPHTRLDLVTPPQLDLTVNMVSFQEMTTDQVRAYVHRAADQGSPYLYSLNRERSLYNPELLGVRAILEERFWPHEIEVLPVSYVRMLDGPPKPREVRAKERGKAIASQTTKGKPVKRDLDYKHLIGWCRVDR